MAKPLKKSKMGAKVGKLEPVRVHRHDPGDTAWNPSQVDSGAIEKWLPWAFFPLFFGLCWLANPTLQYHIRCPEFYWEASFFAGFLSRPGGAIECFAALLLQCFANPWLGAAIQTGLAGLIYVLFRRVLFEAGGTRHPFLALAPVAFLLPLQNYPASPAMEVVLGMLLGLSILTSYSQMRALPTAIRAVAILVLSAACYCLGGGILLFMATLGCLLALGGPKTSWPELALWAGAATVVPLALTFGPFILPHKLTYVRLLLFDPQWPATVGLLSFPAVLIAGPMLSKWRRRASKTAQGNIAKAEILKVSPLFALTHWASLASFIASFLLASGLFFASFDRHRLTLPLLDYYARHGRWEQVLREAGRLGVDLNNEVPAAFVCASIDTMRALYHQGRLTSDFFSFQHDNRVPMMPSTTGFAWCVPMSELLFELGQVNYAEHWAHEALELKGERPELLLSLSKINRLLGRPQAGRNFLNRLEKNPFQSDTARLHLEEMDRDPLGTNNLELNSIRALMPANDNPSPYLPAESQLEQVLRANPKNRMAYEYLMIHHLLNRSLDDAVGLMRAMVELGYKTVPRHMEEAFLLYTREHKLKIDKIMGLPIAAQTIQNYARYDQVLASLANRKDQLLIEMERQFPGTYWKYYVTETLQAGLAVK
jgi:hypothetical protein